MLIAGIKELKNNLSKYLSYVKNGEDIVITERGKTIARIIREPAQRRSLWDSLKPLVSKGLLDLPSRQVDKDVEDPIQLPGKPLSEIIIEDRR